MANHIRLEYGPLVATAMDLFSAAKQDHGLADYVEKARAWLKRAKNTFTALP